MSDSRVPLHARVEQALRERLTSRELRPGDLLPSEAALQAEFDVSRSVVRQALATLESDGLIRKVRGKGSVVAEHGEVHRDVLRSGLTLHHGEGEVSTRVSSYDVVPRPDHLTSIPGERVLRLGRVRSVGGVVLSFIRTWLPADVASAVSADDLVDASLHALLSARLDRVVTGGQSQVRAVQATDWLAEVLGVAPGSPLLLLEGRSLDADGVVLEEFSTWHRGDLAAFDIDAMPPSASQGEDPRLDRLTRTARDLLAELEGMR
ncbi:GntR family transcriptional regulator [Nocardioides rotundus]|uniref:GntR family transcriptional regulator n=1 Tax=Nocardioides rotundus TaxID=1774216 RepID=UPI001CC0157E|nr:GntR family transcriptional regulator [Nocardioides rotundus]UAL31145.1 GntR family transcriptional regulator [Nocardioides rotundus]